MTATSNEQRHCQPMNPVSTFDPSKPAMVHDRLNDRTFKWKPETMQANYEEYANPHGPGIIAWDGLLRDGWSPISKGSPRPRQRSD